MRTKVTVLKDPETGRVLGEERVSTRKLANGEREVIRSIKRAGGVVERIRQVRSADGKVKSMQKQIEITKRDARGQLQVERRTVRPSAKDVASMARSASRVVPPTLKESAAREHAKYVSVAKKYTPAVLQRMKPEDRVKVQAYLASAKRKVSELQTQIRREQAKKDGVKESEFQRNEKLDHLITSVQTLVTKWSQQIPPNGPAGPAMAAGGAVISPTGLPQGVSTAGGCTVKIAMKE